jgi:hypothetical protein
VLFSEAFRCSRFDRRPTPGDNAKNIAQCVGARTRFRRSNESIVRFPKKENPTLVASSRTHRGIHTGTPVMCVHRGAFFGHVMHVGLFVFYKRSWEVPHASQICA